MSVCMNMCLSQKAVTNVRKVTPNRKIIFQAGDCWEGAQNMEGFTP